MESGSRYEIRKKYWEFALPQLQTAFGRNGSFSKVNPTTSNWVAGAVGVPGIHIDCVANFDEARVEFYLGTATKEKNKALFDALYAQKSIIESKFGTTLVWCRLDDKKASKIYLSLTTVNIATEADWPRMARFHVEGSQRLFCAFKEPLEQYFNTSL